jgi:hypothetical protein
MSAGSNCDFNRQRASPGILFAPTDPCAGMIVIDGKKFDFDALTHFDSSRLIFVRRFFRGGG